MISRPKGHRYLYFQGFLINPVARQPLTDPANSILYDGSKTTEALEAVGFNSFPIFLTDVVPLPLPYRKFLKGETIRPRTDNVELYNLCLRDHVADCQSKGGEVTILFGKEVEAAFEEMAPKAGRLKVLRPSNLRHNGVVIDAEIWIYNGNS